MEIKTLKDRTVKTAGDVEKIADFSIAPEAMGMFFQAFSDSLYSDKFGSIVREIASNAVDSHTEAKNENPVEIELIRESAFSDEKPELVFRDFGTGMSPQLVKTIFSQYFSSTKRADNTQIGGWGIGSKSPFAYADVFTVITWHENKKYTYLLHRGEKNPEIKMIDAAEEVRPNGTEVRIPVKEKDIQSFLSAIRKQLIFFDNIKYINLDISNTEKIIHADNFITVFDENKRSRLNGLCISLGKVYYPINWDIINSPLLKAQTDNLISYSELSSTDVALKFEVGDLPVTLSREGIEYKDGVVDSIVQKILDTIQELRDIAYKLSERTTDFKTYLERRKEKAFTFPGGYAFRVDSQIAKVTCIYEPFEEYGITIPTNPFFQYETTHFIQNGRLVPKPKSSNHRSAANRILNLRRIDITDFLYDAGEGVWNTTYYKVYRYKKNRGKKINLFLEGSTGRRLPVLLQRNDWSVSDTLKQVIKLEQIVKYRDKKNISTSQAQQDIYDVYNKTILKEIVKNIESYQDVQPDEAWLEDYKQNNGKISTAINTEEEITIRKLYWYGNNVAGYTKEAVKLKNIRSRNYFTKFHTGSKFMFIVYGTQDQQDKLRYFGKFNANLSSSVPKMFIVKVAINNMKYFENVPFAFTVEEADKIKERLIKRMSLRVALSQLNTKKSLYYYTNNKIKRDIRLLESTLSEVKLYPEEYVGVPKFTKEQDFLIKDGKKLVSAFEIYERLREFADQNIIVEYLNPSIRDKDTLSILKPYIINDLTPKHRIYAFY